MKRVYVIGGGTVSYVRAHLAISAPAYGTVARELGDMFADHISHMVDARDWVVDVQLTKMADHTSKIETTHDLMQFVSQIVADPDTKAIIFTAAVADFDGQIGDVESGKKAPRLKTDAGSVTMNLSPSEKIISTIRKERKDIFLVGFKTTAGDTLQDMYNVTISRLKKVSANLFFANDIVSRRNMIVVPEESHYGTELSRVDALQELVKMTMSRCRTHFTRSIVTEDELVAWDSPLIPSSLRSVVDYCIRKGAYKKVNGVTAGHFAVKHSDTEFITSIRKTDFNKLSTNGMVLVESTGPDSVIAHGAKPSVGGQSQRIIFSEHDDVDCIVHFHCPTKPGSTINIRPQWMYECGSHECGQNTSDGLRIEDDGIKAVYLDKHGPNIVFNRSISPDRVISFIDRNFDLSRKTDEIA